MCFVAVAEAWQFKSPVNTSLWRKPDWWKTEVDHFPICLNRTIRTIHIYAWTISQVFCRSDEVQWLCNKIPVTKGDCIMESKQIQRIFFFLSNNVLWILELITKNKLTWIKKKHFCSFCLRSIPSDRNPILTQGVSDQFLPPSSECIISWMVLIMILLGKLRSWFMSNV